MPLVSIIVPFFNAENTIERCVNSILGQTYKDFELLLLDDGSTDHSGQICDRYAEKDARVHVLHKENSGVSDTRNQGIAMAAGEYLQFLDSDDWIAPEATAAFVHSAMEYQCDMVIADFYRVIGERVSQKGDIEKAGLIDRAGYAASMLQKPADFYYGVLWNKFYKRSIIEKYQIKMDTSLNWCEDFLFNMEYIRHIHAIYVLKIPVYYYVKTKGSLVSQGISMKKTIQMKRTVFEHYNDFYKEVFDDADYEKRKGQIYRFLIDAANDGTVLSFSLSGNYRLGSERISLSDSAQEGDGIFFDLYRETKLLDRVLELVALRNDLVTADVKLLYFFSQSHKNCTVKETAELLRISRRELSAATQRLLARELIVLPEKSQSENRKRTYVREYAVTPEADTVLSEILFALCDLEQIQYEGFSQEEIELYERLSEKRSQNIKSAFRT